MSKPDQPPGFACWTQPAERGVTALISVGDGFIPTNQREWDQLKAALLIRQDWKCEYCACPLTWRQATFDHLIPRVQDGTDHCVNLAMACQSCNSRKGGRSVLEWLEPDEHRKLKNEP